jgi:mRNA-degrading endonuclease RelE of RelBE toxin-antitoxin system
MPPDSGDEQSPDRNEPPTGAPEIHFSEGFERDLKRLEKKYRHIRDDVREALESPTTRVDAMPGYSHELFKARIPSRDMQRGSRGGFRLLAWRESNTPPAPPTIYLVTIYAKSERQDLDAKELRRVLERFFDWMAELAHRPHGRK